MPWVLLLILAATIPNPTPTNIQIGTVAAGGGFSSFELFVSVPVVGTANPDGTNSAVRITNNPRPTPIGFDSTGRLYAFVDSAVEVFDRLGRRIARFTGGTFPATAMAFDSVDNLFLGTTNTIRKYSADHTLQRVFVVAAPIVSLDLASDQCTMYYQSSDGRIRRHDVCIDVALPDTSIVFTSDVRSRGLRILPDATLLVLSGSLLVRVSPAGQILRVYELPATGASGLLDLHAAIALDTTGDSFWVAVSAGLEPSTFRYNLATGDLIESRFTNVLFPSSLAVFGERRAAQNAVPVPAADTAVLILIAFMIVAVGLVKLR